MSREKVNDKADFTQGSILGKLIPFMIPIGALIGGSIVVFAVMSAVLFIIMIVFSRPIAVLMQAPEEAVSLTSVYVRYVEVVFSLLLPIMFFLLFLEDLETVSHH